MSAVSWNGNGGGGRSELELLMAVDETESVELLMASECRLKQGIQVDVLY